MERLPKSALEMTTLPSIKREYSLAEIATMTRAAPARLLGLADRGHLGPGARADIAVYDDRADRTAMFRSAHLVFKDGEVVVRDGKLTNVRWGRTLAVHPDAPKAMRARLSRAFEERYGRPLEVTDVRETAVANAGRRGIGVRGSAMPELIRNGVRIDDTFAEAFGMRATAIVITADSPEWARQAAVTMTGFATSVIACGCEAGIDRHASMRRERRTGVPAFAC